jgi:hypothetical protein
MYYNKVKLLHLKREKKLKFLYCIKVLLKLFQTEVNNTKKVTLWKNKDSTNHQVLHLEQHRITHGYVLSKVNIAILEEGILYR